MVQPLLSWKMERSNITKLGQWSQMKIKNDAVYKMEQKSSNQTVSTNLVGIYAFERFF